MIELADLYGQYLSIEKEIDNAITSVISHSAFIGEKTVRKFEASFSEYTGAEQCITVANGTDALEIAIEALDIHGENIVVPAMTAVPTVEAVVRTGNTPIFCDIDTTYTLDVAELEKILTKHPVSAIIPVHLYGAPAHMASIRRIANECGISVIEDCAQAHGTKIDGVHVGTTGIVGCFSFYPGKNLGAYGDGGAIITNSGEIAKKCRMLRDHGRIDKFEHLVVGRNSRMDGIQAAILDVKLRHLDDWITARQVNAGYYNRRLMRWGLNWSDRNVRYTYHQYPLLVQYRDELMDILSVNGIKAGIHYPFVLPDLPPYQKYAINGDNYINSRLIAEYEISLPVHEMLSLEDLNKVCDIVEAHYDRIQKAS